MVEKNGDIDKPVEEGKKIELLSQTKQIPQTEPAQLIPSGMPVMDDEETKDEKKIEQERKIKALLAD